MLVGNVLLDMLWNERTWVSHLEHEGVLSVKFKGECGPTKRDKPFEEGRHRQKETAPPFLSQSLYCARAVCHLWEQLECACGSRRVGSKCATAKDNCLVLRRSSA